MLGSNYDQKHVSNKIIFQQARKDLHLAVALFKIKIADDNA